MKNNLFFLISILSLILTGCTHFVNRSPADQDVVKHVRLLHLGDMHA